MSIHFFKTIIFQKRSFFPKTKRSFLKTIEKRNKKRSFNGRFQKRLTTLETMMWIIKIINIKCVYPPRILEERWCIFSCLQIPPRKNWYQYVRRKFATVINFPCLITLDPLTPVFSLFIAWNADFLFYKKFKPTLLINL